MPNTLEARVAGALTNVRNPRVDNDVISAGMVQDLVVSADGVVKFTFLLGREDPAHLVRDARRAVRDVEGVKDVEIQVAEPKAAQPTGAAPAGRPQHGAPAPAPDLSGLGRVIAVSSGKGGVGKSTISVNLAVQLAQSGQRVGIMDADIYGPNIPRMFGVNEKPEIRGAKIIPLEAHGVKLMSLGLMVDRDTAAIWRGPIIMKIITQFLRDVDWGTLDYFIVDLPPGTGDAQLSLVQAVQVKAAVIVTTPQEMAVGDALRGAKMFEKVNVPVLGIVENMSYFVCPDCGHRHEIFLHGGGKRLAEELGVPLLGQIPLQAGMTDLADSGKPVVIADAASPAAKALQDMTEQVRTHAGARSISLPILTG